MFKRMLFAAGIGYVFRRMFGGGRSTSPFGSGNRLGRRGW